MLCALVAAALGASGAQAGSPNNNGQGQPAPNPVSAPTISGSTVVGSTLSASTGSWSGPIKSYSYAWQRCGSSCSAIGGATGSSYTLQTADAGSKIAVVVTANGKSSVSQTSAQVGPVTAPSAPAPPPPPPPPSAPAPTSAPAISGSATQGATLSASTGTWSGSPTSYSYQWLRCSSTGGSCNPFTTGNGLPTYTLTSIDVGSTMKVSVTAANTGGSATSTSGATGVVAPLPAPAPTIAISAPAAGATISGSVPFTATVANGTPTEVDFTIDGGSPFTEYQSPYVYNGDGNTLDTTKLANGTHTLAAKAVFADGSNVSTSETVNVQNVAKPIVTITAPAAGATISGSVPFTATVTNGTPTEVDFTIDGGSPFVEYGAPYVYNGDGNTLDTTKLANGTHTLAAKAVFADGSNVSASETVTVQNTATAPATGGSNGLGLIRLGSSYSSGTGYDRYSYVIVGYGDVDKAAALPGTSLVYKGGVDVVASSNTDLGASNSGVSYNQASANGWLLKDASGNVIRTSTGYLGDVGNPAFQQAWVNNVSTFLLNHHADGVFIDNVLCSVTGLSNGVVPALYPSDTAFANAMASFIAYVGPALHAKGLYVSANAFCYGPDNGSANTTWWTRLAPSVDALMNESFEQNPNNEAQLFYNSPTTSWMGNWLGKLDAIKAVQNAGKAAFVLSYGAATNTTAMTYLRASFLLVWNGTSGGFFWGPDGSGDPWNAAWTQNVGTPTGAMTQVGGAFVRQYSGGYVVVNPSLSSATVSLPSGLKTITGAAAGSSVTLASTTAAIFTY